MATPEAQRRAVRNHRRRMRDKGLDRFEVRGLSSDKPLLRAIAQRLARGDATAGKLRAIFEVAVAQPPKPL